MACPSEKGATIPVANVGNPIRQMVFLVNSHSFREPVRGTTPFHEDSLPEVPTPERLNSLLPAVEGLTDQTFITLMPNPQYSSPSEAQCSNVEKDRICNTTTTPLYRNVNATGQLSSEVHGEEIKTVTATPDWGFDKFKSADQGVTGDPNREMTIGVHRDADFHRLTDSRCTQGIYIERNGNAKSTKYLTSNCINCIAPSTLRQVGTSSEFKQIPSSIATKLTDTICMESHSQLANSKNNSTTDIATEIFEKPICNKYYETTNSLRKDNKQNERNDHNGIVDLTGCLINGACHEKTKVKSDSKGNQHQEKYPTQGSSRKRYILITTRIKSAASSRCMASVAQDESSLLTRRITIPSRDDKPKTEDTSTQALTSPQKLHNNPINESHTSNMKQLEHDNPTYLKLSKAACFPDCLPSPDKTFLSALLSEDNRPFEEWFAAKNGDIGPLLKEFITEGASDENQLKITKGTQNKETKRECDKGRERKSEMKTDKSLGDDDTGISLPDNPETIDRLKFKQKDAENDTTLRSEGTMAKAVIPIPSKLISSSTVLDNTKHVNEHKIEETVIPKDSEYRVELADHQYSLSTSHSGKDVVTPVNWGNEDDKLSRANLDRDGSVFENRQVGGITEGDVVHPGNGKGSPRASQIVRQNLLPNGKDCSHFDIETDLFDTPRSRCEGNANVTSVNKRRKSLRVGTLTSPGPTCFTDTSVTMQQSDGIVQAKTKRVDDVLSARLAPDKSSFVNNVMQQRKLSTHYAMDVNTNQNCSRDKENKIESSSLDSKEVGSGHSPCDIQPQSMPVRDEQSRRKPFTRQSIDKFCKSGYITLKSKNKIEMKPDDVRGYVDDKRNDAASTEGETNLCEQSQDPSSTSAISEIGTKEKDAFSQSKRKHDYNLRSCNRYKSQSSEIAVPRSHQADLESSLKEEVVQGVLKIQGDHQSTHVKCRGQGVDGNQSNTDKSYSWQKRALVKLEVVSDISKQRPAQSSRKTEREHKRVNQPARREIRQTPSHERAVEVSTVNDHDHRLVENTCVSSETDTEIEVHPSGHSTVGYADIVAKGQEPSPSYLTRHFIRNLEVIPKNHTLLSTEQRKTKTKISSEGGNKYTITKCSEQELAGCNRLTQRSQTTARRCAKRAQSEEKRSPSKIIEERKDIFPPHRDQPSNRTSGLLKVKFPFICGRKPRKVQDQSESPLKRKSKETREDVATSRSTKIASAPKMTMKLRLKPLRRGLQLKQSVNLLRRKKAKSLEK